MAKFTKYFQDEIAFLRELGKEFAEENPDLAPFLAEGGEDPDVRRLLEGFAFLSGRIRQKLDDEYPEITHSLMGLLWPHVLRPVPSLTTIEFDPIPGVLRDIHVVEKGVRLDSTAVAGTNCRFRTTSRVELLPLKLERAEIENPGTRRAQLRLSFQFPTGVAPDSIDLRRLRLHFASQLENAFELYLWLSHHVTEITLKGDTTEGAPTRTLPRDRLQPVGFPGGDAGDEALWPFPRHVFGGYRLLQEYFTFSPRFLYMDVLGLEAVREVCTGGSFDLVFHFKEPPSMSGRLESDDIRLFCTPAVNLFEDDADPIRLTHDRVEYRVRPPEGDVRFAEPFSVDEVFALKRGSHEPREVLPLHAFRRDKTGDGKTPFYVVRLREAVVGRRVESYLSFVYPDGLPADLDAEVAAVRATFTNGDLPEGLRVGDVRVPTESSPQVARFRNITVPTPTIRPPISGELHWRLISHMGLNQLTLTDVENLRGVLDLYNIQAQHDRQTGRANERRIQAVRKVASFAEERLFRGTPIRGRRVEMDIDEDGFLGEGDLYLFAAVLNEFLSLYATINSFTRLRVTCAQSREIFSWPARIGTKNIL